MYGMSPYLLSVVDFLFQDYPIVVLHQGQMILQTALFPTKVTQKFATMCCDAIFCNLNCSVIG